MGKAVLVEEYKAYGRDFIKSIEASGAPVDSALWIRWDEPREWELTIASAKVDQDGPKSMYMLVYSVLSELSITDIDIDDVSVRGLQDSLILSLKEMIGTGPGIYDCRFASSQLYELSIMEVFVYRMIGKRLQKGARVKVKKNNRYGRITGTIKGTGRRKYLVMYDMTPDTIKPLDSTIPEPAGENLSEEELEFLYIFNPSR